MKKCSGCRSKLTTRRKKGIGGLRPKLQDTINALLRTVPRVMDPRAVWINTLNLSILIIMLWWYNKTMPLKVWQTWAKSEQWMALLVEICILWKNSKEKNQIPNREKNVYKIWKNRRIANPITIMSHICMDVKTTKLLNKTEGKLNSNTFL